ncbi:hypothetical protein [Burkholderia sp. WP9]|uniref:hypothetical protein n=1 Tax=Burkholderia sp. WP9 TaxID=1500263 RepID=UPI00115FD62D|nr:hypothetical protein [Burkholderia sp. WP9]
MMATHANASVAAADPEIRNQKRPKYSFANAVTAAMVALVVTARKPLKVLLLRAMKKAMKPVTITDAQTWLLAKNARMLLRGPRYLLWLAVECRRALFQRPEAKAVHGSPRLN